MGRSDHSVIEIDILTGSNEEEKPRQRKCWEKAEYEKIRLDLRRVDWRREMNELSTDQAWKLLREQLGTAVNKWVPVVEV